MNHSFSRGDRISREIGRAISEILIREASDKRLRLVSVTRVEMSPDLSCATVYYVPLMGDEDLTKPLKQAQGFLRSALAARLALRYTPELRFALDARIAKTRRIEELLKQSQDLDKPHPDTNQSENESQ